MQKEMTLSIRQVSITFTKPDDKQKSKQIQRQNKSENFLSKHILGIQLQELEVCQCVGQETRCLVKQSPPKVLGSGQKASVITEERERACPCTPESEKSVVNI